MNGILYSCLFFATVSRGWPALLEFWVWIYRGGFQRVEVEEVVLSYSRSRPDIRVICLFHEGIQR